LTGNPCSFGDKYFWESLFVSPDWLITHHKAKRAERISFVRNLAIVSSARLLDVGCGIGAWSNIFASETAASLIVGIDRSHSLLQLHTSTFEYSPRPKPLFLACDVQNLPFGAECFDVVFVANTLAYFEDIQAALDEICKVTVSGGRVILRNFDDGLTNVHPCDPALVRKVLMSAWKAESENGNMNFFGRQIISIIPSRKFSVVNASISLSAMRFPFDLNQQEYIRQNVLYLGERARKYLSEIEYLQWISLVAEHSAQNMFVNEDASFAMGDYVIELKKDVY
jgi:ubiquinone/menaquinone biosynthesis C-methylase UbiE